MSMTSLSTLAILIIDWLDETLAWSHDGSEALDWSETLEWALDRWETFDFVDGVTEVREILDLRVLLSLIRLQALRNPGDPEDRRYAGFVITWYIMILGYSLSMTAFIST